jgi:ESS family glutamate:Na+ symporter
MAMMSLNLVELTRMAGPMLVILSVQAMIMAAYAYFLTFRVMGSDYAAAVMAGGHCGFGLGATPNAVANMEVLAERFGHSPRAFLVVTIVGAFLIDFTNAITITTYLNFLK